MISEPSPPGSDKNISSFVPRVIGRVPPPLQPHLLLHWSRIKSPSERKNTVTHHSLCCVMLLLSISILFLLSMPQQGFVITHTMHAQYSAACSVCLSIENKNSTSNNKALSPYWQMQCRIYLHIQFIIYVAIFFFLHYLMGDKYDRVETEKWMLGSHHRPIKPSRLHQETPCFNCSVSICQNLQTISASITVDGLYVYIYIHLNYFTVIFFLEIGPQ